MHSTTTVPPARYHTGGLPDREPPLDRYPLDRDTPGQRPPWTETPLLKRLPGHVTYNACWDRDPPVNRTTHRCKNITLPQASFAGGNYLSWRFAH